jgi:hypothetical protein
MKKLIVVAACFMNLQAHAQNGPVEQLAQDFFSAVKYVDTAAYANCFINNKDLYRIMYHYVRMQDSVNKDSIRQIIMPDMPAKLAVELVLLRRQFADSGVRWSEARYINCYYNLLKEKNAVYPSLTGEIIFESAGRQYSIIWGAAVFMDERWKLVTCRLARNEVTTKQKLAYFLEADNFFGDRKKQPAINIELSRPVPVKKKPAAVKKVGG